MSMTVNFINLHNAKALTIPKLFLELAIIRREVCYLSLYVSPLPHPSFPICTSKSRHDLVWTFGRLPHRLPLSVFRECLNVTLKKRWGLTTLFCFMNYCHHCLQWILKKGWKFTTLFCFLLLLPSLFTMNSEYSMILIERLLGSVEVWRWKNNGSSQHCRLFQGL